MRKTALITGISGQDGSYLSELLLEKNYAVHGIERAASKNRRFDLFAKQLYGLKGNISQENK